MKERKWKIVCFYFISNIIVFAVSLVLSSVCPIKVYVTSSQMRGLMVPSELPLAKLGDGLNPIELAIKIFSCHDPSIAGRIPRPI